MLSKARPSSRIPNCCRGLVVLPQHRRPFGDFSIDTSFIEVGVFRCSPNRQIHCTDSLRVGTRRTIRPESENSISKFAANRKTSNRQLFDSARIGALALPIRRESEHVELAFSDSAPSGKLSFLICRESENIELAVFRFAPDGALYDE